MKTMKVLACLSFFVAACSSTPSPNSPKGEACTAEAKVCPDGSSVGRTLPGCEFPACPGEGEGSEGDEAAPPNEGGEAAPPVEGAPPSGGDSAGGPKACTMEVKTCPDGSSVGRTGPNCEFAPCPK